MQQFLQASSKCCLLEKSNKVLGSFFCKKKNFKRYILDVVLDVKSYNNFITTFFLVLGIRNQAVQRPCQPI